MKNMVVIQKTDDGNIYYKEITERGYNFIRENPGDNGHWSIGRTVTLEELVEILDKEI